MKLKAIFGAIPIAVGIEELIGVAMLKVNDTEGLRALVVFGILGFIFSFRNWFDSEVVTFGLFSSTRHVGSEPRFYSWQLSRGGDKSPSSSVSYCASME